jgi:DNA-binding MarR family transcriptional regulator
MVTPTEDRPPMDPSDWRLQVWRGFLHAHATVIRELERELSSAQGMSLAWYDVLLQLAEAPERRLRMAQLADRVLLSRSGLTRLVDRLEAEGLVRREPSPRDARGTYTVLTVAGIDRLRRAVPTHLGGVREHWIGLFSDDELRALGELFARFDEPAPGVPDGQ